MWTREEIEDLIQRITCELLPKVPPQDIRPAYQQSDMAGKSLMSQDGVSTNYLGFLPENNFIYIRVKIGPERTSSFVDNYGAVDVINTITVTYTIYGNQSSNIALCLYSLLRSQPVIEKFEEFGFIFNDVSEDIIEMREIINELWYERHDFDVIFKQDVSIPVPKFVRDGYLIAKKTDIDVITHEEDETSNVE